MNKKLLIGIISGVVALAVVIVGIFVATGKINLKKPDDNTSSVISSDTSGVNSDGSLAEITDDSSSNNANSSNDASISAEKTVEKGTVKIEDKTVKNDESFDIPIVISENPGMMAAQFEVKYDSDVFEFLDVENGKIFDELDTNPVKGDVKCLISTSKVKDIKDNGTLVTVKLKVKSNAKKGDYEVKIENSMFVNYDEQVVSPKIGTAKITVK